MRYKIFLFAMICILAACNPNNDPTQTKHKHAPYWNAKIPTGPVNWVISDTTKDITSTMIFIISIPASQNMPVTSNDLMAVFSEEQCLTVEHPIQVFEGWRFFLVVYRPYNISTPLTVAYYSDASQTTYYWRQCVNYEHDAIIGSATEPYIADLSLADYYPFAMGLALNLPDDILRKISSDDELALFSGDTCRYVFNIAERSVNSPWAYQVTIPMNQRCEYLHFKYYCAKDDAIYTSDDKFFNINDVAEVFNPITFK